MSSESSFKRALGAMSVSTLTATLLLISGWTIKSAAMAKPLQGSPANDTSQLLAQLNTAKNNELIAQTSDSEGESADATQPESEAQPDAQPETQPEPSDGTEGAEGAEGEEDQLDYSGLLEKIENGEVRKLELDQLRGIVRVQLKSDPEDAKPQEVKIFANAYNLDLQQQLEDNDVDWDVIRSSDNSALTSLITTGVIAFLIVFAMLMLLRRSASSGGGGHELWPLKGPLSDGS